MYSAELLVKSGSTSADEVVSAAFRELLTGLADVEVSGKAVTHRDLVPRATGLEVFATFATSAAAYQLARAVRDFVNRQHVNIEVRIPSGEILLIKAAGGDTTAVADLVGFLTNQHLKRTLHASRPPESDNPKEK